MPKCFRCAKEMGGGGIVQDNGTILCVKCDVNIVGAWVLKNGLILPDTDQDRKMEVENTDQELVSRWESDGNKQLYFYVYEKNNVRYGNARFFVTGGTYSGPTRHGLCLEEEAWEKAIQLALDAESKIPSLKSLKTPRALGEFNRGSNIKYVIQYLPDKISHIDIRKFVDTKKYTGWSKNGLRVQANALHFLIGSMFLVLSRIRNPRKLMGGLTEPPQTKMTQQPQSSEDQYYAKLQYQVVYMASRIYKTTPTHANKMVWEQAQENYKRVLNEIKKKNKDK